MIAPVPPALPNSLPSPGIARVIGVRAPQEGVVPDQFPRDWAATVDASRLAGLSVAPAREYVRRQERRFMWLAIGVWVVLTLAVPVDAYPELPLVLARKKHWEDAMLPTPMLSEERGRT